jgi:NADH-quinone oxidoreductase subunit N
MSVLGTLALLIAGALALHHAPSAPQEIFNGAMVTDGFGAYAKALIAFAAAAALVLGADHFARLQDHRFEFPVLILLAVLGMFIMASANDLITLYVGLELQGLCAYVLAAWRRDDARSSEAGLKYFILGALASGLLLYGASFVYGSAGAIRFEEIAAAARAGEAGLGLVFGLVLMLCGLAFKVSAAPFHMWTPDVYEGAPTPVTAFFAAAPKAAALALTARVLFDPFTGLEDQWRQVLAVLAGLSMLVGAFAGLVQTNMKRLLAYSSIANMGFVLMGLSAGAAQGGPAMLVYLSMYLPASIGVFALLQSLQRKGEHIERIEDFAGLGQRHLAHAALLTVLVFSLAGVPPLAGFFGKYAVFAAALDAGLWPLAIVGALAAAVAAGYYLKVLAAVWFAPGDQDVRPAGTASTVTALVGAVFSFPLLLLALGVIERAARSAVATSF